jgi:hypothetical protein
MEEDNRRGVISSLFFRGVNISYNETERLKEKYNGWKCSEQEDGNLS